MKILIILYVHDIDNLLFLEREKRCTYFLCIWLINFPNTRENMRHLPTLGMLPWECLCLEFSLQIHGHLSLTSLCWFSNVTFSFPDYLKLKISTPLPSFSTIYTAYFIWLHSSNHPIYDIYCILYLFTVSVPILGCSPFRLQILSIVLVTAISLEFRTITCWMVNAQCIHICGKMILFLFLIFKIIDYKREVKDSC